MELASFDKTDLRENGVSKAETEYLNKRLSCELPQELELLYFQTDGFGAQINDLFVEFWNIDQIISFNEIYEEAISGQYIFFASSDERYDSYAYQKVDGRIYAFLTDCGVEDIADGKFCANDLNT